MCTRSGDLRRIHADGGKVAISQLQELTEAENRENGDMLAVTKEIAALNEQNLILNRLRERSLIPTDSFLQKNAQISARLAELKRQRRLLLEADEESGNTARRLKELLHTIDGKSTRRLILQAAAMRCSLCPNVIREEPKADWRLFKDKVVAALIGAGEIRLQLKQ